MVKGIPGSWFRMMNRALLSHCHGCFRWIERFRIACF
jgi:hypothetical protein